MQRPERNVIQEEMLYPIRFSLLTVNQVHME